MINSAVAASKTLAWLDSTGEARFENFSIDMAINNAILNIVRPSVRSDDGKGDGRFPSISVRSELSPLIVSSTNVYGADEQVTYEAANTLQLMAGYSYKLVGDITDDNDWIKLIVAGFKTKLDGNGAQVLISTIRQISPDAVVIRKTTKVSLSKAYVIRKTVSPTCVLNASNVIERTSLPDDFAYMVAIRLIVGGESVWTIPKNFDELPNILANPNTRPSLIGRMKLAYNIESGGGFKIEAGKDGIIQSVEVLYLPTPTEVFAGKEYDLSMADTKDALLNKTVVVRSDMAMISNVVFRCGEEITIYGDYTLQEGIVAYGYRHSNLPSMLTDEVCMEAAKLLSVATNNKDKQDSISSLS